MIKKLISAAAALSMLAAFAVAPASAAVDEDAVVYNYTHDMITSDDYYVRESDGAFVWNSDTASKWGIKLINSWTPTADNSIPQDSSITYSAFGSPRSAYSSGTDVSSIDLSYLDTNNALSNVSDGMVTIELDYGISMRGNANNAIYQLRFTGTDSSGAESNIAVFEHKKPSNNGTSAEAYFLGMSDNKKTIETTDTNNVAVKERDYIRLAIDFSSQTYSAWFVKKADSDSSYSNDPELLFADQPFYCGNDKELVRPSKIYYTVQNNKASDTFVPVSIKATALSDQTAVDMAKTSLTLPSEATSDLTLPAEFAGTDIAWISTNPDVISNDGKVTPTSTETAVTMTATISRGSASATKEFTITVPAEYIPIPVPEDGVWANEEINYTSVSEMKFVDESDFTPQYQAWEIKSSTPVYDSSDAVTDTTNGGYAYLEDGKLVILKGDGSNSGDARYRYAYDKQHSSGTKVLEWRFSPIGDPADIQMNIASLDSYTGVDTIYYRHGVISTYKSNNNITVDGDVILTAIIDIDTKTYSLYVNGELLQADIPWRGAGQSHIGRLGITVASSTSPNDGIALDYIRLIENTDYYSAFCLNNEAPDIPTEIPADINSIELPEEGKYNNTITWSSNNEDVISTDGKVTHSMQEFQVQLTPTYTNNVTGAKKEGTPITVTVKVRDPEMSVGEALEPIYPELAEGETQYAVGFMNTFEPKGNGYTPEFGFTLYYPQKPYMVITAPATIESNVTFGIILTYDETDNFELDQLKVKPFITE